MLGPGSRHDEVKHNSQATDSGMSTCPVRPVDVIPMIFQKSVGKKALSFLEATSLVELSSGVGDNHLSNTMGRMPSLRNEANTEESRAELEERKCRSDG